MNKIVNRSAQRGAVFVESIVVISFSTLCFLGVLYFREVYLAKLHVQRLARASAMSHAMRACTGDVAAGLEKDLPPKPPDQKPEPGKKPFPIDPNGNEKAEEALAGFERSKSGTPLDTITKVSLTTSASAMTKNDQASPEQGFKSDVSSTSFVTCGDPVTDGQYEEIFPYITSLF